MKLTQEELVAECRRRFGDDPANWAFVCPNCGDVATLADHPGGSDKLGQECVGGGYPRGCDWTAYGLLGGPWTIEMPDGTLARSFALADPPAE